ncbi:MAG: 30S ribosomal protein S16 [Fulvivirga sp.]
MAVKIRLARRGRKKQALYDVVVADARAPRDGRYIEKIGRYNPNTDPATVDLDDEKAFKWVMDGAQPTDTVRGMLSNRGIMLKKHLQIGVNKGAITQEDADKKFNEWLEGREAKVESKKDRLIKEAAASAKARKEAETKVKEARAEALKKKNVVEEEAPVAEAEATAETSEEVDEPKADVTEEAQTAEEPKAEEAKAEAAEEPKAEEAKAETVEEPKAEEPKEEELKEEEPKAEEAKAEEPKAEAAEEKKDEAPAEGDEKEEK